MRIGRIDDDKQRPINSVDDLECGTIQPTPKSNDGEWPNAQRINHKYQRKQNRQVRWPSSAELRFVVVRVRHGFQIGVRGPGRPLPNPVELAIVTLVFDSGKIRRA